MKETLFDQILARKIPADIVYEDEDVLAFKDINPQAPVHILVIPKKRSACFTDLIHRSPDEVGRFFIAVSRLALELNLNDSGYRLVLNNGRDGGQTVDYLHAHILAGRKMAWPPG